LEAEHLPDPPAWKRLHRLAATLEPDQLPYFVASVDRRHRAPGWYWRPAGVPHAVYLGYNRIVAEIALLEVVDRQQVA
jgi:hypothetical protein